MSTGLQWVATRARKTRARKIRAEVFTSLNKYLTKDLLREGYGALKKGKALGVDGASVEYWLGRRGNEGKKTWEQMDDLLSVFPLPPPKIKHSIM